MEDQNALLMRARHVFVGPTAFVVRTAAVLLATGVQSAPPTFFLVAPPVSGSEIRESFVVPLTRDDQITQARDILSHKTDATIVIVDTVYGSDGVNRNHLAEGFPLWNWHVQQVVGFAHSVAGTLDFRPSHLESGSTPWPPEIPTMRIGPSIMTIVKELGPTPLELSIINSGGRTHLAWSTPGSNWVYTVESASLPGSPDLAHDWRPIPGTNWPIRTNRFDTLQNSTATLFRVQATLLEPAAGR